MLLPLLYFLSKYEYNLKGKSNSAFVSKCKLYFPQLYAQWISNQCSSSKNIITFHTSVNILAKECVLRKMLSSSSNQGYLYIDIPSPKLLELPPDDETKLPKIEKY